MTTCKDIGVEEEGDCYVTDKSVYKVKNVTNSSEAESMKQFWKDKWFDAQQ